jgi:hypothetical protein
VKRPERVVFLTFRLRATAGRQATTDLVPCTCYGSRPVCFWNEAKTRQALVGFTNQVKAINARPALRKISIEVSVPNANLAPRHVST